MTAPANLRGWGQGWPANRSRDMRRVVAARSGAKFDVHYEIAPIVKYLIDEVERRGYLIDNGPADVDDDWSYANRPIRGRNAPSNHSWGLAIDINAQDYPLGSSKRLPQWIVDLFLLHGFDYGGDWSGRKDPMHFEFNGWPSDARKIAAAISAPLPPVNDEEDDDMATYIRLSQRSHKHTGRVEVVTAMHRRWVPGDELALHTFLGGKVVDCKDTKSFNQWTSNKEPIGSNGIRGPI